MACSVLPAQTSSPKSLQGTWEGALPVGKASVRIVFHLSWNGTALTGTMDSLDQGVTGIHLSKVKLNGRKVDIELEVPLATYSGTLGAEGTKISGTWNQNGITAPLNLHRTNRKFSLNLPQRPKPPFPYRSEDVTFPSKAAGVQLAGTLTLPQSGGPFPAVLLITGSGPQDRDETFFGHKPFLVVADYLTRCGIAVLRVDDRGVGKSTGVFSTATMADFVKDAAGSVAYLKSRKEIDPKRSGLIGHSGGGDVAAMLAAQDQDVSFVVMMAGPGVKGSEVIEKQVAEMNRAHGASPAAIKRISKLERRLLAAVRNEHDPAKLKAQWDAIAEQAVKDLPPDERAAAAAEEKAQFRLATSPWFRYFLTLDPASFLCKVKVPVLAMDGSLDLEVSASQNLPAIAKALAQAGNPDYEIVEFPHLNHLFQTAKTGLPTEYAEIHQTIAPVVLKVMGNWILRHTSSSVGQP